MAVDGEVSLYGIWAMVCDRVPWFSAVVSRGKKKKIEL